MEVGKILELYQEPGLGEVDELEVSQMGYPRYFKLALGESRSQHTGNST